MYELTKNGVIYLSDEENNSVSVVKADNNFHYLAFDYTFDAYSPLNIYLSNHEPSLIAKGREVFDELQTKKEVRSFKARRLNLTLYPVTIESLAYNLYEIDLKNIDKHFNDILRLNDNVYRTKYLMVDFGHGPSNLDLKLVLKKLMELLEQSRLLKRVFLCEIPYPPEEVNKMILS